MQGTRFAVLLAGALALGGDEDPDPVAYWRVVERIPDAAMRGPG